MTFQIAHAVERLTASKLSTLDEAISNRFCFFGDKKMTSVGRLETVAVQDVWPYEDKHFTPWLSERSNLTLLADALSIGEIQLQGTEVPVGDFALDIIARDNSGRLILIENQYGPTDHKHLGQLMTYFAGQNEQGIVVWIAERVREEHRAAVDWLNANTVEGFDFFAAEIEVLRIGESLPAPWFNVVSKPNSWSRRVHAATRSNSAVLTDRQKHYVAYWSAFKSYLDDRKAPFKVSENVPYDYWCGFPIGKSGFRLACLAGVKNAKLSVELYMGAAWRDQPYNSFLNDKEQIEGEMQERLIWTNNGKSCKIAMVRDDLDPVNKNTWPAQFEWLHNQLNRFSSTFSSRILNFNVSDEDSADEML